jgi:hypothetical protein
VSNQNKAMIEKQKIKSKLVYDFLVDIHQMSEIKIMNQMKFIDSLHPKELLEPLFLHKIGYNQKSSQVNHGSKQY